MCLTPIKLSSSDIVPCGRCQKCKMKRAQSWAFRLTQEMRIAHSGYFLTLTYDTKYLPFTRNHLPTLYKRDIQLFFKRLRKAHGKGHRKIIYFLVGEYGDRYQRPHYHAIIFNAKPELIEKAWNMGACYYGKVQSGSIFYTLKYMQKQVDKRKKNIPDKFKDRDMPMPCQQKPFCVMSKGIGIDYINEKTVRFHMSDIKQNCVVALDGYKMVLPRYYKEKIYTRAERFLIEDYFAEKHQKARDEEFKLSQKNKHHFSNKKAAIKASFERMYKKAVCKTF